MDREAILDQLAYLWWLRDRVLTAAAALTPEEYRSDDTVTTRSLCATLVHQLENEWAWRIRLRDGVFPDDGLTTGDFPTIAALATRWRDEERAMQVWLATLSGDDLAAAPTTEGPPLARWRYLLYVVNHGTQQFSEAAVLLTRLGHSPGEIGYLAFCLDPDRR